MGKQGVVIQMRSVKLLSQMRYEMLCVYHATCKGYYLGGSIRRPSVEHTTYNRNVAMAYGVYNAIVDLMPEAKADVDAVLTGLGLNPNDKSESLSTPIGVGNYVSKKVIAEYHNDGTNQLGNIGPHGTVVEYNRMNYSDYT
jgi:hypothetical protein